jgi:hypothetical protein
MEAAGGGHSRPVELLIAAGADVAAKDDDGSGHAIVNAPSAIADMPSDAPANSVAGGLHSRWQHFMETRAWSSCSSRPTPTSWQPRATPGRTETTRLQAVGCCSQLCCSSTALMVAAGHGRERVVELLIAAGADIAAKTNSELG